MKGELLVQLILLVIFGAVAAAIASSKGRSVVGWFFGGFFLGVIGIIIVACLSNLNEKKRREEAIDRENRRLREQLYQEQMKAEAFRRHAVERLDVHDVHLGVDTRSTRASITGPEGGGGFPLLGQEGWSGNAGQTTGDLPFSLEGPAAPAVPPVQGAPPQAAPARQWFYGSNGQSLGPISEEDLIRYIRNRQITPQTLVWTAQLGDWKPAGQVAHLQQWMRS